MAQAIQEAIQVSNQVVLPIRGLLLDSSFIRIIIIMLNKIYQSKRNRTKTKEIS
jgi:hypothetical protein